MESQFAQLRTMVFTIAGTMTIMFTSTTFSLSARSKRRRAGRKKAGELAPKLEAAKPHQDGQLSKQPTRTLAQRIDDPKDEVIRKLASRITDTLVADISNAGTDEDQVGA
ncbi:hypothetical protein MJO28_002649 [Puccinia striiformis f. sp. tritici]|uniref:Uncharacterized protein n=3 Tax=Puccinia striiformis TaxID=27350 RepID=A0A0L0V2C3_9BASI|nr:hypothetical protein Pst134EB_006474 [Puccinia striiformis f. sp. tritici]KAI7958858.1 hypothetical protein MJO28_002649 [Puccinia striiformis f. sp. tritici]KAI7964622.1 hypothetical protein MJO29_002720 [Puccinia striiformis f. sp. tritici]KNE93437.1 hypothetical protein PSTG_13159 [Puccinia striiformis f. sp. tritici PST-78]POW10455.1 hypothetical protein PSTT_06076 [Puccinia striiformis]